MYARINNVFLAGILYVNTRNWAFGRVTERRSYSLIEQSNILLEQPGVYIVLL